MSIKSIKSQIDYFLALSNPFVMAIKGDWGIGKTFSWNKYLAEARKEDRISGVKYSYVSLFGIKSIEQLKEAIFSNAVSNNHAGEQPSLQTFQNNAKNLVESFSKNSWKFMKDVPYLNYAKPAVDAWSFMSISRYLICIDDLERKGTTLEIKEVLGLVSLLKEQKDCKVVLLLNDGTNEVEDYKKI
ncbi:KAP family NTPase [Pantoea agglomerans]|nr:KAP family NTPase [Pantoea agglomerans]